MPEEPTQKQSVERCADLRARCRDAIFEKMDTQHSATMSALGDIRESLAEDRGARDSSAEIPAARRWSWREVAAVIAISAGAIAAAVAAVWKGMA